MVQQGPEKFRPIYGCSHSREVDLIIDFFWTGLFVGEFTFNQLQPMINEFLQPYCQNTIAHRGRIPPSTSRVYMGESICFISISLLADRKLMIRVCLALDYTLIWDAGLHHKAHSIAIYFHLHANVPQCRDVWMWNSQAGQRSAAGSSYT